MRMTPIGARGTPGSRRPTRTARATCLCLPLLLALATGDRAHAQETRTHDVRSWIDAYYMEYAAMSAAPTGPAMDRWLARYAPFAFFEDPTLGQGAIGVDSIRAAFVAGFTGPLGPVRWTVLRRATDGEWTAVEGWLAGSQRGRPFRTRFSTWFRIRDGVIAHQIDYIDYAAMRRQVADSEPVPPETPSPAGARRDRDAARALRLADEFYRRYESMPRGAGAPAVAAFTDLLTDDFRLEDPTARARIDGREPYRDRLNALLATGGYGRFHWAIDRRVSDGEWVAVEGTWRGVLKGRPFATRFTTWLRTRDDRIAHHIDYLDYATFRRQTAPR